MGYAPGDPGHLAKHDTIDTQLTAALNEQAGRLSDATLTATFVRPSVIVRARTALESTDTAAFNEALSMAGTLAGTSGTALVVWQPGRSIITSGGHVRPAGVSIDFGENPVSHTGNNVFLDCHAATFDWKKGIGVSGLILTGNAGAAAVGLEIGNTYGFSLRDIMITGYTNGIGIDFHNRANWCEGTMTQGVFLHYNATGIRFVGSDGGTNSFGYNRLKEVSINVAVGGIGILIGPAGIGGEAYLYNSSIEATIWLDQLNATGIVVGTNANVVSLNLEVVGEGSTGTGGVAYKNLGGVFKAYGHINFMGGLPSVVTSGNNLGDPEPFAQNALFPAGTDGTHGGVLSLLAGGGSGGSLGTGKATNLAFGFASGFDFTGSDIFRIYSVPFGSGGNNPIGPNGRRQFGFDAQGIITMFAGSTTDRVSIVPRQGTPEGNNGQGPGSIALRSNGHAKGYDTLYVKTTARNTTTGWVPMQPVVSGTTANRPASPSVGWMYFDTTLNKPIWYGTGAAWVDATGATV